MVLCFRVYTEMLRELMDNILQFFRKRKCDVIHINTKDQVDVTGARDHKTVLFLSIIV